jgi:phytol kinase
MMFALSLLICGVFLAAIRFASMRWTLSPEVQRKLAHVTLGLYSLSLPWIFEAKWQVAVLCGVIGTALLALRFTQRLATGWHGMLYSVGRISYGEILFCMSVAGLFAIAMPRIELYLLPLTTLTLADAAAALVGVRYGRIRYAIDDQTKSWEGSVIFFLVAWLLALVILILTTSIGGWPLILMTLIIAIFAAMVEAISWRGLDNLFVPVGVFLLLEKLMRSSEAILFIYVALLAGMLWVCRIMAKKTGFSRTTLWTICLALLFMSIDGSWESTVFPGLLAALILMRKTADKTTPAEFLPDLLALIAPAIACFVISRVFDYNTSFLFNMMYLLQITALLLEGRQPWRWAMASASAAILLALRIYMMPPMPGAPETLLMTGMGMIAVVFAITFFMRQQACSPLWRMVGASAIALPALLVP